MRTIEQQGKAWHQLLKQVEKSPVTISYRGLDDHDKNLYEVKNRIGVAICTLGTEKDLLKALEGGNNG